MIMKERLEQHISNLIDRYPKLIVCREDIIKAYESGFNAFFSKPVDYRILFSKMAEEFGNVST